MSPTKLDALIIAVDRAVEIGVNYFAVAVDVNLPSKEIIVNTVENMIEGKLEYYSNAYNDNLELKVNNNIKIANFGFGDTLEDIEKHFLD